MATGGSGTFEPPKITELFPAAFALQGTPFAINRIELIRIVVVVIVAGWLILATRNMKIVPGRFQVMNEALLGYVRNSMAIETLGEEDGRRWLPLIMTMFFLVLGMNITSIVPFVGISGAANPGLPLVLAVIAWGAFIYAGFRRNGWNYLKNALFIPGVPKVLYILLTPLEILSTFIVRPVTLMLRLLMNMVAGHLLLALIYAATSFFLFTVLAGGMPIGLLGIGTGIFGIVYAAFEIFVALLQAYVFALLTAIYIQLATAEEH